MPPLLAGAATELGAAGAGVRAEVDAGREAGRDGAAGRRAGAPPPRRPRCKMINKGMKESVRKRKGERNAKKIHPI
jgi:hypothetical protein